MKFPAMLMLCVNRFVNCAPKAVIAWQPYRAYGRIRCSDPFEDPPKAHCAGPTPITLRPGPSCEPSCKLEFKRMDNTHYQTTDKRKMRYEQTWADCPEKPRTKKKLQCFSEAPLVPIKRRKRSQKPITATCPPGTSCQKLLGGGPCIKIQLPGCKAVRDPPSCTHAKEGTGCKRYCAPYPSFSECQKTLRKPGRKVECTCYSSASLCDIWKILKKDSRIKN